MQRSLFNLAVMILSFGTAPVMAADDEVVRTVDQPLEVGEVIYGGRGCPAGSVSGYLAEDGSSLDFDLRELNVEAGEGVERVKKYSTCQLALDLKVPAGMQYAISSVRYRGFAFLQEGGQLSVSTLMYFQGQSRSATAQTVIAGPTFGDINLEHVIPEDKLVFSDCAKARALNIKASVMAQGSDYAFASIDQIGVSLLEGIGVTVRQCPAK